MAAFTVTTMVGNFPAGPFNGKIFKLTSAGGPGAANLGLNVKIRAAINLGGEGATVTTGNIGNWVLNSSAGTADNADGQIYGTNATVTGKTLYVWVLF